MAVEFADYGASLCWKRLTAKAAIGRCVRARTFRDKVSPTRAEQEGAFSVRVFRKRRTEEVAMFRHMLVYTLLGYCTLSCGYG